MYYEENKDNIRQRHDQYYEDNKEKWFTYRETTKDKRKEKIKSNGIEINVAHGGKGTPLLLLHGYPQTNLMWHK